jgi:hypothetical protein
LNLNEPCFSRTWIALATGLVFLYATACNFSSPRKSLQRSAEAPPGGGTKHQGPELIGASYCVETMAQNPRGPASPVHFAYKVNDSDQVSKDYEADLSGDTFDRTIRDRHPATDFDREMASTRGATPITIQDGFAETVLSHHYTRDDKSSWTEAWGGMEQGGTPWSLFVLKPAVTPAGFETISGFETLKYVVDTTHQSQLDKYAGNWGWGTKDYNIVGSAWVTKHTGCILQYAIDLERTGKDGKLSKSHYEGSVTKQ